MLTAWTTGIISTAWTGGAAACWRWPPPVRCSAGPQALARRPARTCRASSSSSSATARAARGAGGGGGGEAGAHLPGIIKLVVGYSAGGPVDGCARLLAPALAAELGTQVIVENRPGASGSLGGDAVAKAPPDGAMIYFGASPTITINPNIQRKMSFDPGKDLLPIAPLLTYTNALVVNPELPVRNVGELLAYARANPRKLFFGSAGIGASNLMSAALLERITGAPLSHVPYKVNASAMSDAMAGNIAMMFDIVASARAYITSGKVRAPAVTPPPPQHLLPPPPPPP